MVVYSVIADQVALVTPLFRRIEMPLEAMSGYSLTVSKDSDEPLAYIVEIRTAAMVIGAGVYKKNLKHGILVELE